MAIFVSVICLLIIALSDGDDIAAKIEDRPFCVGIFLYGMTIMFSLGSLTLYHMNLVMNNKTTHESMRDLYERNPFDLGCSSNCASFCCETVPPS